MAPPTHASPMNPLEKHALPLMGLLNNLLQSIDEDGYVTDPQFTITKENRHKQSSVPSTST